jgi:hypothetical protein
VPIYASLIDLRRDDNARGMEIIIIIIITMRPWCLDISTEQIETEDIVLLCFLL